MPKTILILAFAAILGAAPISDWFLGNTLASGVWTSQASGGTITQSNGGVTLSAPAASTHDGYPSAVKISQTIANSDLSVITKISTIPPAQTNGYYECSLGVYQDANNYVKIKYWSSSGSAYSISIQRDIASTVTALQTSARSGDVFPIWFELSRSTNAWDGKYSFNGTSWTDMGGGSATITAATEQLWVDNWNSTGSSVIAYAPIFYFVCNSANDTCIPPVRPNRVSF